MLEAWDREPHVIVCSSDRTDLEIAFDGIEWPQELAESSAVSFYQIAEIPHDGAWRPIGVMQVCDPHLEPTHYWGEIEPDLRAMDIWIGPSDALNRGYGAQMMTQAIDAAFAEPNVVAIVIDPLNSNAAAHRFYRRLGFRDVGRRMFDEDDCLVMRLDRTDWRRTGDLVIPAEAKRRAGTAAPARAPGPAEEPGQTQSLAYLSHPSPGSTLAGRSGVSEAADDRAGSPLRPGRAGA
jgi:aminoglycoside 6'-N-acetyltransferase